MNRSALDFLRDLLTNVKSTGSDGFEGLVAEALAEMTGLVFRLAKSGSQFGRDASTPSGSFAIAMEAKRRREAHQMRGNSSSWVSSAISLVTTW